MITVFKFKKLFQALKNPWAKKSEVYFIDKE